MQPINITQNDRILIVAPHPDDECIGAGGVLALYPQLCDVVVLTDGSLGQGNVAHEIEKEIRRKEFIREMEIASISEYNMLNIEDGTLMRHTDCMVGIDMSKYTKIFVTGSYDNHPDHTAAFESVFNALEKQRVNADVYLYEVHAPLHEPTHMLDITNVMEIKKGLIRVHKSQVEEMPYDRLASANAEYRALQNRMKDRYIEVYSLVHSRESSDLRLVVMEERLQKHIMFYQILTKWMSLELEGKDITVTLKEKGYKNIAVYGYAELGQLLCRNLIKSGMNISYVLDKKVKRADDEGLIFYVPDESLAPVDAVIVTAVYYFDEIRLELESMGFVNVISLKNLIEDR